FFFQAEDGIRDLIVTGVQTCALPISAVAATEATASLVLVPAPFCADAIMEAADAGIRLVVTITDGVPAQDMMTVKRYLWRYAKRSEERRVGKECGCRGEREHAYGKTK